MHLRATLYDGKSAARQEVKLMADGSDGLVVEGSNYKCHCKHEELQMPAPVGRTRYTFYLPDGAACEIESYPALAQILPLGGRQHTASHLHRWENSPKHLFTALALTVILVWAMVQYGLPLLASRLARDIPPEFEAALGRQSMELVDSRMFEPSALPLARQHELLRKFQDAMGDHQLRVEFRQSDAVGANAFALPSGIIVFTDDLIKVAHSDEEIIGVFLHEVGHIEYHHVMQQVLRNSFTALLLVVLTGDVGSASSLAATMPTLLIQSKHSRLAEEEADHFAARILMENDIAPAHLANILQRIEEQHDASKIPTFLSSHPGTSERRQYLENFGEK